jgi:hypothetical protein
MTDAKRVVVYYAIWTTLCAAVAGTIVAVIHTAFFAFNPGRSAAMETFFQGIVTALAIAAGQGAVALVTGGLLAQVGRSLNLTVLLGLVIGVFDFLLYFLQMAVPATELGWVPDIAILVAATVAITLIGARAPAAAS